MTNSLEPTAPTSNRGAAIAAIVVTVLLILMFALSGAAKLFTAYSELSDQMRWVAEFSEWQVRGIGALEVAAALGLLFALFVRPLGWAARIAPIGLAILMVGALVTHIRIDDPVGDMAGAIIGLVLSLALVALRWGPAPPRRTR